LYANMLEMMSNIRPMHFPSKLPLAKSASSNCLLQSRPSHTLLFRRRPTFVNATTTTKLCSTTSSPSFAAPPLFFHRQLNTLARANTACLGQARNLNSTRAMTIPPTRSSSGDDQGCVLLSLALPALANMLQSPLIRLQPYEVSDRRHRHPTSYHDRLRHLIRRSCPQGSPHPGPRPARRRGL
jgi:hypothetical protein